MDDGITKDLYAVPEMEAAFRSMGPFLEDMKELLRRWSTSMLKLCSGTKLKMHH